MQELQDFLSHNRCPHCNDLIIDGTAHGNGFVVGYHYCEVCDEFIYFNAPGLLESKHLEMQNFLRKLLKDNIENRVNNMG